MVVPEVVGSSVIVLTSSAFRQGLGAVGVDGCRLTADASHVFWLVQGFKEVDW